MRDRTRSIKKDKLTQNLVYIDQIMTDRIIIRFQAEMPESLIFDQDYYKWVDIHTVEESAYEIT